VAIILNISNKLTLELVLLYKRVEFLLFIKLLFEYTKDERICIV